jgi:hypothetical protein
MFLHSDSWLLTPDSLLSMFVPSIIHFRPLDARADLFAD